MVMGGLTGAIEKIRGGGRPAGGGVVSIRGASVPLPQGFPRTLSPGDFMDTATPTDITTVNGSYVNLGNGFSVPAQTGYRWGHGNPGQPANQGYIYLILIDDTSGDATQEDGDLRLSVTDANGLLKRVVWEGRTEELDGDANDKQQRIALPEQGPLALHNDVLLIEFKAAAVDVIQPDFCTVRIPVTLYQPL